MTSRERVDCLCRFAWHIGIVCIAAALAMFSLPGKAQALYRCTEANGKITYSGKSCKETGNGGAEKAIDVPLAPARPPPALARSAAPRALAASALTPAPGPAATRRVAAIRLFYDPANAPVEHPLGQMEGLIRRAVAAWAQGCAVELEYGGTAPYVTPGSPERVSIRWSPDLMYARHPDNDAVGIAGTGSLRDGVSLRPRVADEDLPHIVVHEIGHVLGIGHLHEEGGSVMSYLPDKASQRGVHPSAADYLACNRAMQRRFGVALTLPAEHAGRRMNDRDAINRKLAQPPSQ